MNQPGPLSRQWEKPKASAAQASEGLYWLTTGESRGQIWDWMEGVLEPYGQAPASLQLWTQPSFELAEFLGHHGGKMAVSA